MKKNFIIVTGGAGFIGSSLIRYFLKIGIKEKIVSIDNYSSGYKKNHVRNTNVKYITGENKNIDVLLEKYKNKIKVIFHFGEYSRIFQSFKNYKKCFEYNIHHSSKVIEFAKDNKIKLIYSATSSNLGNSGKDENLSPYAWSKSKNIELIKNYNKWFGLKYEFVYFYNVYGPGQILNSPMSAVIGIFEQQFKRGKPLTIVKPGTQRRDFTYIDDIVEGCYLAWKKGNQNHYMLGTKKTYTIIQIAKMFGTKIKYIPTRAGERFGSTITNNNAKKILGYSAKKDIRNYIKEFINKK
ncbi:MAG: ADP-L-glycero-D-manno-heptose-6-epimerase [Pelagibacteraceae bacterium TMED13]|nr:MAG: ADP-L-glycero-D-manno-heptose-6-epimerase [Pelagibacteraceae bacterium TMED13]|tara:strand:+ start:1354 stop:2238 length:885 start_codon:yes stop_codon:yes gene_type:complete